MAASIVTDWISAIGSLVAAMGTLGVLYFALVTLRRDMSLHREHQLEEELRPPRRVFVTEPRYVKGRDSNDDPLPAEDYWIGHIHTIGNPLLDVHLEASLDGRKYIAKELKWLYLDSTPGGVTTAEWTVEGCSMTERPTITVSFTDPEGRRWSRDSTGRIDRISVEQEQRAKEEREQRYAQSRQASLIDVSLPPGYQERDDQDMWKLNVSPGRANRVIHWAA